MTKEATNAIPIVNNRPINWKPACPDGLLPGALSLT